MVERVRARLDAPSANALQVEPQGGPSSAAPNIHETLRAPIRSDQAKEARRYRSNGNKVHEAAEVHRVAPS